jgi:hypothetical protein
LGATLPFTGINLVLVSIVGLAMLLVGLTCYWWAQRAEPE